MIDDENKKNDADEKLVDELDDVTVVDVEPNIETLEDNLEELASTIRDKDKELLYLRAEFDNFKKQTLKERTELLKYAGQNLALDLLSVVDVFEKALELDVNEKNYKTFVDGVKLTEKQLNSQLDKHGIREIKCKGEVFDPNKCEALSQVPSVDAKDGEVIEVMRKGYMYHDKVLRHAQVVIASAAPSKDNDQKKSKE